MLKSNIPVILLKNLVLLPLGEARIELNNDISKKIIEISRKKFASKILVVTPLNDLEEVPDTSDLPSIGVLANVTSKIDLPNGNTRIVLSRIKRVRILNYSYYNKDEDALTSEIIDFPTIDYSEVEETALFRKLMNLDKDTIKECYMNESEENLQPYHNVIKWILKTMWAQV